MAITDIYLKISNGLEGESADETYKNHIDIGSFHWGVQNQGAFSNSIGAGGGSGRSQVQPLTLNKKIDKSSPLLFWHCATGQHLENATLFVRRAAGTKQMLYFQLAMKKVFVTQYSPGAGNGEGALIAETFQLDFEEMEMTYWQQQANGDQGPKTAKLYNAATGKRV